MARKNNMITMPGLANPLDGQAWRSFATFLPAVADAAAAHWRMLVEWQRRDQERNRLRNLDDHLLEDIGLTRTQVMDEADKPFWRP